MPLERKKQLGQQINNFEKMDINSTLKKKITFKSYIKWIKELSEKIQLEDNHIDIFKFQIGE